MRIKLAKTAGFCWGVKRALDSVLKIPPQYTVYTYGPLIHNEQVVQMLRSKGVNPVTNRTEKPIKKTKRPIIVIRAHGAPPVVQEKLSGKGYKVIDATCPHVKNSQQQVMEYARKGYHMIIVGDKAHAEVFSLVGYAQSVNPNSRPVVVSSKKETIRLFNKKDINLQVPICILAQSTFQPQLYQEIIDVVKNRCSDVIVLNTICPAPTRRQREVVELSKRVEAMVVVGDHKSANTSRLAALSRSLKVPTFQVADETELPLKNLKKFKSIGITAGTSTPDWVIQAVINRLKSNDHNQ
ncbi:MAG: 4-hydroxy-3-methylbut-2-enyl diphosphate reductase [Candidatus Brocadiia bacterium]